MKIFCLCLSKATDHFYIKCLTPLKLFFNKKFMPLIIEIAQELNNRISNFKKDKNAYTYSDISNLATNLLIEHEDIRNEIKNNLKMIVIDEYQDK